MFGSHLIQAYRYKYGGTKWRSPGKLSMHDNRHTLLIPKFNSRQDHYQIQWTLSVTWSIFKMPANEQCQHVDSNYNHPSMVRAWKCNCLHRMTRLLRTRSTYTSMWHHLISFNDWQWRNISSLSLKWKGSQRSGIGGGVKSLCITSIFYNTSAFKCFGVGSNLHIQGNKERLMT